MFKRQIKFTKIYLKRAITQKKNTPRAIAMGATIGTFVALTPTFGFQIIPTIVIASLLKGNRIVALIMIFISNPITVIPIYSFSFYLGTLFLPNFENARMTSIIKVIKDFNFKDFANIGIESLVTLWVGSLFLATLSALGMYITSYYLVNFYKTKKENYRFKKLETIRKNLKKNK